VGDPVDAVAFVQSPRSVSWQRLDRNDANETGEPRMGTPQPIASLKMVTLDCGDPAASASFWNQVLGWEQVYSDANYAMLTGPDHALGFGRVDGYRPPDWPNPHGSKQFHLDLAVEDLEAAEKACVELGATVPAEQPGEGRWRVLLDPAGHPFCLTRADAWG
jgi:catechol 2,3-dioxygenase-like lactoylglutathione lyase family enzyme